MAENTKIEWCRHSFNPWRGCTKVSAGCAYCYAETLSGRNSKTLGMWGPNGTRVVASEAMWREPVKWNKGAAKAGERHRVFCASLADVFEDWRGPMVSSHGDSLRKLHGGSWITGGGILRNDFPLTMQDVRVRLFALIDATPNLDWLILSKRPENMPRMMPRPVCIACGQPAACFGRYEGSTHYACNDCCGHGNEDGYCAKLPGGTQRHNLWLGTSVENQAAADERVPHLLKVPAAVRFLSCEPLLGPLDIRKYLPNTFTGFPRGRRIGWVIVGGESGPHAKPMHPDWVRSLRDQCQAANVPFFFKQWGEYSLEQIGNRVFTPVGSPVPMDHPTPMFRVGKKAAGRMLDGREWNEFPIMVQA